jgi:translation initiation factor 2 subunit 3
MLVARSFDVNKPGFEPKKLCGGVLGGAIAQGKIKIGDEIEIRPGIKIGSKYKSLVSKVVGIQKAGIDLEEAGPGGLLGVMTSLDPFLTKSDALIGNIVGFMGKLPEVKESLTFEVKLLERIVGSEELKTVAPIKSNEDILINVGTARSIGTVANMKKNKIEIKLKIPVCLGEKERVVISRQINGRWRLIGFGNVI